jgi:putative hydrolase of the HAD superfamily
MNIVFDFVGVLFSWRPRYFLARMLPQHAPDLEAAAVLAQGFFEGYADGDWARFDRGLIEPPELAERIARRTGVSAAEARAVIDAVPQELLPVPATVALLQRLHAHGHALYFLSNMPAPYADRLEAAHAFLALFRAGVFSARVKLMKPDAAIYALAIDSFGIAPDETVFIDDLAPNVEAARAAGWQGVHFTSPAQCEAELQRLGALPPG